MNLPTTPKEKDELEVKDDVHFVSSRIKALIESKEYSEQKFVDPILADLKNKMLTAVAQVNKWKRAIISQHEAEEKAKLEYMTKSERVLWFKYFETLGQKKHLEEFLQTLKKPDESDKEATHAFAQITSGVKNQIADLDTSLSSMKKPVEDIRRRLELPDCRNNILLVTHQILQANTYARKMLKRATIDLDKAVDDLRNALFVKTIEEPQPSFKTREVYDLIRQQYRSLKKEHEDLFVEKFHLQRQIISPERALAMAKNIFVHGDFKRLREEIRRYKKEEQRFAPKLLATRDWSVPPRSTFSQKQYYLTKQRTLLEQLVARFDGNNLEMEKDWEMMSECDKDEIIRKKIIREL